ncbi:MAG: hypothetical protein HYS57_01885 [Parcubacteria group bacterium]|nr:hypothetical protein [Parcubacteria group bacterium]
MAKTVRKITKPLFLIFRLAAFFVILAMLWPLAKIFRNGNSDGVKYSKREESGRSDSLFAPLVEKFYVKRVKADIPPH